MKSKILIYKDDKTQYLLVGRFAIAATIAAISCQYKKRLVKAPRVYVRDSGITHTLLGIADYNQLSGHPVFGTSWEGFVIDNLLSVAPPQIKASFYCTSAGAEIDLVLELPGSKIWVVENKSGLTPKLLKGFYNAL